MGYTYAGPVAAQVITGKLADVVQGRPASTPAASWAAMQHAVRNLGKPALVAEAISAVDIALCRSCHSDDSRCSIGPAACA